MAGVRSTKKFLISGDGFETNFILGNLTIKFELFFFRWSYDPYNLYQTS